MHIFNHKRNEEILEEFKIYYLEENVMHLERSGFITSSEQNYRR